MTNVRHSVLSFLVFLSPLIYFGVSYRFPLPLLFIALNYLLLIMFILGSRADFKKLKMKLVLLVLGSFVLYGLFKAISFSDFDTKLHTFLYYSVFNALFFMLVVFGTRSKHEHAILYGFIASAIAIQAMYITGNLNWNQYQIVGNVTIIGLLASYRLKHYYLMVIFTLLVLNTPSSQAQVLLIFFYCYLMYNLSSSRIKALGTKYLVLFVSFLISVPAILYLFITAGDFFLFSDLSNERQFDFMTRISDRSLIFYDHVQLIRLFIPPSQSEINASSAFSFISGESKVHGIWLAYLVYMGFVLGGINLLAFLYPAIRLLNGNIFLLMVCLTPWLVSSEVNPIKYAICALAITSMFSELSERRDRPKKFPLQEEATLNGSANN